MAGYNYQKGISNNAERAYKEGKIPKSGITKKHLKDTGINESLIHVKRAIKDGHIHPCEWHHTGGDWFNETDFYDLKDIREQIRKQGGLKQYYQSSTISSSKSMRVKGSYPIWGGSRKNPKRIGEMKFTGTLKSNGWIYLDDGRRKNSNGNWISWEKIKK